MAPLKTDFNSRAWLDISRHIDERIAELQLELEGLGLPEAQTQQTRGRIAELRLLLKQQESRPQVPTRDIYQLRN